jgi:hypothetical protein
MRRKMARKPTIKRQTMHQLAKKLVNAVRKNPDLEWAERYACVASIEYMAILLRRDGIMSEKFKKNYGTACYDVLVRKKG